MKRWHRRWIRLANGPLPDPLPVIRRGVCPGYEKRKLSCTDWPRVIWLNRWDFLPLPRNRRTLYHEFTHWFDMQYLIPEDREQIRLRYGWPDLPWWYTEKGPQELEEYDPLCEWLAMAGEEMYLHPRKYRWLRSLFRLAKGRVTS